MEPLSPVYLSDIASQTGGLSAFLGGFSATFMGALLALGARGRAASVAAGLGVLLVTGMVVSIG